MLKQQALRFLFVGALNTLVGYCLYAFFIWLGFGYALSLTFATILGVLFNFKSIGALVFKSRDNALLIRFASVYLVVYAANMWVVGLLVKNGMGTYLAGIITIVPLAVVSFLLNKYCVFKR